MRKWQTSRSLSSTPTVILITPAALRRIDTELMDRFDGWKAARGGQRTLDPAYHASGKRPGRAVCARVEVESPTPVPAKVAYQRAPGRLVSELPAVTARIPSGPLPDVIDMPPIPSWLLRAQPAKDQAA